MIRCIHKGFTLIELMLIVAIIAILVALALPTYQGYTVRTKVSELLLEASKFKTNVAEKSQQDGGNLASAGVGLTVVPSGKVTGGSVNDTGVIIVGGNAAVLGTAVTVTLNPNLLSDGRIIWTCSAATAVWKFVPAECRH